MILRTGAILLMLNGFLLSSHQKIFAQDQQVADSLSNALKQEEHVDSIKLELLKNLAFHEVRDLSKALKYADQLILFARQKKNKFYQLTGHLQKGYTLTKMGHLDAALDSFLKSLQLAKEDTRPKAQGTAYCAIGDLYNSVNNHTNAILYYSRAIKILRKTNDPIALATVLLNTGDEHLSHHNYDSALSYFIESGDIFEESNYPIGLAYNQGNIGMVYANLGENVLAEEYMNGAIQILEESEDYYPICFYLLSIADIYKDKNDIPTALKYATRSLDLAHHHNLKQQISDASLKLSELYEHQGKTHQSLKYYKNHVAYRDSVNNLETVQKMADLRTDFEVDLREKEIDLLEKGRALDKTYIAIAVILLILSIVILLYFRQRFRTARLLAATERKQHDQQVKDLLKTQETKALHAMVQGRENERKHLAQELHNHLGSLLATIKVNVNGIDENAIPNHQTITTLVDQACTDVRSLSHSLNMGISEDFGLAPALRELTNHLQESGGYEIEFAASLGEAQLTLESQILTYRIVQELLSNAMKHANAKKLSVLLTYYEMDKLINIMIQDNGKGFDINKATKKSKGMGLQSLKQMVEELDGEISFDSQPGKGTTVIIDLPVSVESNLI